MATLPQIVIALAAAIAGEDPAAVDQAVADLEAALGVEAAGVVIDRLLDEEAGRLTADLPPLPRYHGPLVRVSCA